MSNRRLRRSAGNYKHSEPPVLIVRPYHPEGLTSEETSAFLAFNFGNRIADIEGRKSRVPEVARNKYIAEFLHDKRHSKKTHIFFLDDDSPPLEDNAIIKLLQHRKPVVCAPTPIERYDYDMMNFVRYWNTQGIDEGHTEDNPRFKIYQATKLPRKLFRCYRTGGTGLLVRRDVLERLKKPYQMTTYNDDWTDVLVSEDTYFSDKIRKAGFDIWADGNTVCRHFHRRDILNDIAAEMSLINEKFTQNDPLYAEIVKQKLIKMVAENEKMKRFVNFGHG